MRIIDTMGRVLVRTARTGKGPGELTNPVFWFASGDSAVLVFDMATLRLSHFALDGHYVGARQYNTLVVPKAVTGDSIDVQLGNQPDLKLVRQGWSTATEGRSLVGASDPTFETAFPVTEVNGNRRRSLPSHAANQTRFAVGNGRTGEILIYDRAGKFIGSTGKAESSLPSALEVREFETNARSFRFPDGRTRSEESIAADVDRFRKTPRLFFSHTKGLAFDQRGRLWAIGKVGDQAVARIYLDTKYLGSLTIPCHGFADSFDLNGSRLALLCVDKESADDNVVLQLYHIEEDPAARVNRSHRR